LLDLLSDPSALEEARREWHERRVGGPTASLLSDDFAAPIDYRWPEYIDTERGHDWWIPANAEF
jgi:aminobenzoyl-glutamate utilization protein B